MRAQRQELHRRALLRAEAALHLRSSEPEDGAGVSVIRAVRCHGHRCFVCKNASIEDMRYFLTMNLPVVINWYVDAEATGHFSVVVGLSKHYITINDPALSRCLARYHRKKQELDDGRAAQEDTHKAPGGEAVQAQPDASPGGCHAGKEAHRVSGRTGDEKHDGGDASGCGAVSSVRLTKSMAMRSVCVVSDSALSTYN